LQKIDGRRVHASYTNTRSRELSEIYKFPHFYIIDTTFTTRDTMDANMQHDEVLPFLYKDEKVLVSLGRLNGMDGNKVRQFAKSLEIQLPSAREGTVASRKEFLAKAIMAHLKRERERRDNALDDDEVDEEDDVPAAPAPRVRSPSPVRRLVEPARAGSTDNHDQKALLTVQFDIAALKDMLRTFGLPVSGVKADLVARLTKAWAVNPPDEGVENYLNSERLVMATRKLDLKEAKAKIKRDSDIRRSKSRTPKP
jgi:hypothetical protein